MKNSNLFKYVLFGAGVFAVVLTAGLWLRSGAKANVAAQARFNQVIVNKVSPQTLPQVQNYIEAQQDDQSEPEMCRQSREKLLTQKLTDIVRDVADRRTFFDPVCAPYDELVATKDLTASLYKNCQREKVQSSQTACSQALLIFKSVLIAKAFEGRDLADADAETLVHMFSAKISQGELRTPQEQAALLEIANHLVELLPDSPSAHKAVAIARLVSDFEGVTKGMALNPEVDEYVEAALKMNPHDQELQEVAMFRKIYEPGEKISVDRAAAVVEEKPQSSMAHYFLAGALENANRHTEAVQAARQAHDLEPENTRYRETLQKLLRGEKRAFMIQLGLGFDNL